MTAILLALIMVALAAAMTAVYTSNLNFTQGYYNGMVAQNEAEAGIAELLYQLTRDEDMTFGRDGQEIRGTRASEFRPDEAFHVITFSTGSSFPHGMNNMDGTSPSGDLGRTVPPGTVHAVSTGYCRGQYRTVECVIEQPPFPFGLATSGRMLSRDPLVVRGVSSAGVYDPDNPENDDRPGHILCNSIDGVEIRSGPPDETYISGFIKSVGDIVVEQPATVLGGLRPGADASTMVDIDVDSFRGRFAEGIVDLVDTTYTEPQEMDIMYRFSGETLRYTSSVHLLKAFLYVDGDLVIDGPVYGEGLIVVNGNATFNSGTNLSGSNNLAVLASGDIAIRGQGNNFFQGLVYCEGNFSARNVVVMGNTIVNSPDPDQGQADLENVTVVSDERTANMSIEIVSSSVARGQNAMGTAPFPLQTNASRTRPDGAIEIGWQPGTDMNGWPDDDMSIQQVATLMQTNIWDEWPGSYGADTPGGTIAVGNAATGDGAALWAQFVALHGVAAEAAALMGDMRRLEELEAELDGMDPDDPDRDAVERELNSLRGVQDEFNRLHDQFLSDSVDMATAYRDYQRSHATRGSTFNRGQAPMDIRETIVFDLNSYLPLSERVKVSYWQVFNHRL